MSRAFPNWRIFLFYTTPCPLRYKLQSENREKIYKETPHMMLNDVSLLFGVLSSLGTHCTRGSLQRLLVDQMGLNPFTTGYMRLRRSFAMNFWDSKVFVSRFMSLNVLHTLEIIEIITKGLH